jgi:hypothetical protein
MKIFPVFAAMALLFLIFAFSQAKDRSRAHEPYEVGIFEKKGQVTSGQDSTNVFGQRQELRTWVWTVSVGDTIYELRGIYGDKWLSELPIGSKVEIAVGGKHHDRAWIHFDGKKAEAEFEIVGTSMRPKSAEIENASKPKAPAKTYYCDGMWQTVGSAGDSVLDSKTGGNDAEFLSMLSLFKNKQYPALLKTCLASIESAPDWLTPRLFCGLAYAHLNDNVKAQSMLNEFESKTNPSYDAAPCHDMIIILRSLLK